VIDYVIGDASLKDNIERLVIEDKVDSGHQPIVVWVKENKEERGKRGREIRGKEARIRWSVDKEKESEEVLREIEIEKERGVEKE